MKDDVSVLVTINSEGQDINAAQAMITFPTSLLSVTSIDRVNSVFSFWLEEPTYDNSKGQIRFVGGSTSGLSGAGLRVVRVAFKVKGSGTGRLSITDGAIMASDGSGTNVYSSAKGLDIIIPTSSEFEAVKVEREKVQAEIAKQLPNKIGLEVPFYPDPTVWNNRSASFQAKWNIGPDIIAAAISIDENPTFTPLSSSEAMSGNKIFSALPDGIWYVHLRVKNNIGWSPTLHYRIAIDTTPPNPFNITSDSALITNDATPAINFISSDLGSGIDFYTISLDGVVATTTKNNSYLFSPLLPGVHDLIVSAIDRAGNSISQTRTIEILPIATPEITYMNRQVFINEGEIVAGGTAEAGVEVIVRIQNEKKQIVFEQIVPIDRNNNWNIAIINTLNLGDYYLLVTARSKDMASSFPVISDVFTVKDRPMLIFGNFEISKTIFYSSFIFALIFVLLLILLAYSNSRRRVSRRVFSAERDVDSVLSKLEGDIKVLDKNYSDNVISRAEVTEGKSLVKSMLDFVRKGRRKSVEDIDEIDD